MISIVIVDQEDNNTKATNLTEMKNIGDLSHVGCQLLPVSSPNMGRSIPRLFETS